MKIMQQWYYNKMRFGDDFRRGFVWIVGRLNHITCTNSTDQLVLQEGVLNFNSFTSVTFIAYTHNIQRPNFSSKAMFPV